MALLLVRRAKETRRPGWEEEKESGPGSEPVRADNCKITRGDFYFLI
jgi:hypothetical protein